MTLGLFLRILTCVGATGAALFIYIDFLNNVTEMRLAVPDAAKEVKDIQEENIRLRYEIDNFESPLHLMELSLKPEFSHLKHPYSKDVMRLPEGPPLRMD